MHLWNLTIKGFRILTVLRCEWSEVEVEWWKNWHLLGLHRHKQKFKIFTLREEWWATKCSFKVFYFHFLYIVSPLHKCTCSSQNEWPHVQASKSDHTESDSFSRAVSKSQGLLFDRWNLVWFLNKIQFFWRWFGNIFR